MREILDIVIIASAIICMIIFACIFFSGDDKDDNKPST